MIKSDQQAQQIEANGFQGLDEKTDILSEVERVLMPVVGAVFQNYLFVLYDEALELLDCLLFSFKQVTPQLVECLSSYDSATLTPLFPHFGLQNIPKVFLINGIKLVLACLLNSTAPTVSLMVQNNWVQRIDQRLHPTYLKFISEMTDEQKQVIQEIFSTAANRNQSS